MLRFRYLLSLPLVMLTAIVASSVLAASEKSTKFFDGDQELPEYIISYASAQNITTDTAFRRLALQDLAGKLDALLSKNEDETYAGLWCQHSPQFRVIVQFTREGRETIRPYIEHGPLADLVEIREVSNSLKQLKTAQIEVKSIINTLGVRTNSGTNVFENRYEVYVIDRSGFDLAIQKAGLDLPPQVKVVTVSDLAQPDVDMYSGLRLDASNEADCTSGFSVINTNGIKGVITAAHCDNTMSYLGNNLPFQGSAYGVNFDVQWHKAPGFVVRNMVYGSPNNVFIFSAKHRDDQQLNDFVCKYGINTGYTCGYIFQKDFDPDPFDPPNEATFIRVHNDGVNLS